MAEWNPWRDRNAVLFISVSLVAGFGSTAMSLAAGVWVLSLTGSASLASITGFCVYLPVLFGPVLGALVDRLPRQRLLIVTDLALAAALLTLFAVRSAGEVWLVFLVMLLRGVGYVLLGAGEAALLPAALPHEALGRVNGIRMSAQEGTKLVAPLLGAGLFAVAGGPAVASVAAGSLVVAAVLFALIRVDETPRPTDAESSVAEPPVAEPAVGGAAGSRALTGQVRDGVRALWSHPRLRTLVLIASVAMLASGLGTAAVYAAVVEGLHRPATFVGVLSSVQGAGSVLGGLLASRVLDRRGEVAVSSVGALLFAAGGALESLPWTLFVLSGALLIGVGLPWTIIAAMTLVQRETPPELLGRVAATATTLMFAPPALGIPLGAGLLLLAPYAVPLLVSALVTAAYSGVALRYLRAHT